MLCIKERQLERALGAHGTKEANDGIETDHIFMDALYWLIRNIYKPLLRVYLKMQGDMLTRRFITERETTGRKVRGALALHRSNAVGCSERAEARKFMSVGYRVMLAALLMLVRTDARFKDLSINELDRALLWGCLRYRAWSPELTMAVVSQAGCFFGGLLALNVCNGGYATPMLEAGCTLAPLLRARLASLSWDDDDFAANEQDGAVKCDPFDETPEETAAIASLRAAAEAGQSEAQFNLGLP